MSRSRSVRHPVRGIVAGLGLGVGAALQLVHHGRIAIGTLAPYVVVAVGLAFGLAWALLTPAPGRQAEPSTAGLPANAPLTPVTSAQSDDPVWPSTRDGSHDADGRA